MPSQDVNHLLHAWEDGDKEALNRLFSTVYSDLHAVARRVLRAESPGIALTARGLVHELYLRTVNRPPGLEWAGRDHFLAVAALAMRQILVNHALAKKAQKRGGALPKIQFIDSDFVPRGKPAAVIALDDALNRLGSLNERQARTVKCRYMLGLTVEETALVLGVSRATVNRDWASARIWLKREMKGGMANSD